MNASSLSFSVHSTHLQQMHSRSICVGKELENVNNVQDLQILLI